MLPDQQEKFGENINLDPQRQDQAKQYARIQRRFMFLDLVLGAALLITWLLTGWSIQLRNWITAWTTNSWLAVLMYGAVFGGVFTLLNLPLSYYVGYVLPHRFQQSTQDLKSWVIDLIKGLLVSAVLGGLVLEAIYFLHSLQPGTSSAVSNLLQIHAFGRGGPSSGGAPDGPGRESWSASDGRVPI
jgi:STE24 endopeptidase